MAVEIIWDRERKRVISLKMNSAILGMYFAMAAYIIDGIIHIGVDGLFKEKMITICLLSVVLYTSEKLKNIAKDRRDNFSCILK